MRFALKERKNAAYIKCARHIKRGSEHKLAMKSDIKSTLADEKFDFAEIEEIVIKYNATNSITCDQRSGDFKSDCNLILATYKMACL